MCGIAGLVRFDGQNAGDEIVDMTRALAHRGPDDEGFFKKDSVALGHRRLAIIDLETGHQPMLTEDQTMAITFNGEIYNYPELRLELINSGFNFYSRSDTEVVLNGYRAWGIAVLKKLRGMFAFGLVDFKQREVIIARDTFGIKPLHYRLTHDFFAFASEIPALLKSSNKLPKGNLRAIDQYLRFQYIPAPESIYQDVYKLMPASFLRMSFDGITIEEGCYQDFTIEPEPENQKSQVVEIEEGIREAVKAHCLSDVPVGVFLSGGIDSSLIAMAMAKEYGQSIVAFNISFQEESYDERKYAEIAAKKLGIELHSEKVTNSGLEILPEIIHHHFGEPFGDSSVIPTWYLSQMASQQVKVVLSGDGGDEIFGGYPTHLKWLRNQPFLNLKHYIKTMDLPSLKKYGLRYLPAFLGIRSFNLVEEWMEYIYYVDIENQKKLWKKDLQHHLFEASPLFHHTGVRGARFEKFSFAQYMDIKTYLPCDILPKVDIASMCHGLEVRPPFLDTKLAEMAFKLPVSMKAGKDGDPTRGKSVLKQILANSFPSDYIHRPKKGFSIPRDQWFGKGNSARKYLEEVVFDPSSRMDQFFRTEEIKRQIEIHDQQNNNSNYLWVLLVLAIWFSGNPGVSFE